MLTFTFAGDEAGDASFVFKKGASRYFVMAVVATQNPDALRSLLADVRQKSHLPQGFDFHFNSLASAKLPLLSQSIHIFVLSLFVSPVVTKSV